MSRPKLRILCFGDSLTAGWTYFGSYYHPYAERLREELEDKYDVEIEVDGLPGDVVCSSPGRFIPRIKKAFEIGPHPYDWTIVLGGTNDLGRMLEGSKTFEALKAVWQVALANGSKVLALTVPECQVRHPDLDRNRETINNGIKGYRASNYYYLDLHDKVPYHSMPEADRKKYWDDGVHWTPDGYDLVGHVIADGLKELLARISAEQKRATAQPSRQMRGKAMAEPEDDLVILDEEVGDPTVINKGYIVVRKRDLD